MVARRNILRLSVSTHTSFMTRFCVSETPFDMPRPVQVYTKHLRINSEFVVPSL
jgi:hypothetical protein